jgi:cysteine desulfurase
MRQLIYFDHAATTPLHPRVLEAMLPYLGERFGNPSATYAPAREAQRAVEQTRRSVADVLGCRSTEVVFTSGGSESINAALKVSPSPEDGARRDHVVTGHRAPRRPHTCSTWRSSGGGRLRAVDRTAVNEDDIVGV